MSNTSDDLHPTSSEEKARKNHRENVRPHQKKRGLKWFCVDLWWLHLIVLIVCTLCITLPLVYVAYPKIAQGDVNGSKLTVTHMSQLTPAPNAFTLNLSSELTVPGIFHPTLYPWDAAFSLEGANASFMTLTIPKLVGKTGSIATVEKRVDLNDSQLTAFTQYTKALLVNNNITTRLIGKGKLKLGGLPTINVNYNKTVHIQGFGGLNGVKQSNSTLLTTPQPDGATLKGLVSIPNHSSTIVELGNITFGLSLAPSILNTQYPTPIGYATVNNTILYPGQPNTFELRSVANQTIVLSAVTKNATLLQSGLPITVVTRSVEYNGAQINWLTDALATQTMTQVLNISEILASAGGSLRRKREADAEPAQVDLSAWMEMAEMQDKYRRGGILW